MPNLGIPWAMFTSCWDFSSRVRRETRSLARSDYVKEVLQNWYLFVLGSVLSHAYWCVVCGMHRENEKNRLFLFHDFLKLSNALFFHLSVGVE